MRIPRAPGLKLAPWLLALDAAIIARDHWNRLEPKDRRELTRIVGKFKGRPSNLTSRDRSELIRIVRELDLITAGRKLLPLRGGVRKGKR
jgi:hypothetical protein